jgi:hypothetical protein
MENESPLPNKINIVIYEINKNSRQISLKIVNEIDVTK